jgi:HK97 family phage major capsid protein
MNKSVELLEKRAKLWENAKNFLESKRGEDGSVSPEDMATYEKMEADVNNITREIEALERQHEMNAKFAKSDAPVLNNPAHTPNNDPYAVAFWNVLRTNQISNDLNVGTDTQGGYLVPDEFERKLVQALEEHNIMRQLARIIRTNSGELQIPVVATKGTASWINEAQEIPTSDAGFGQATLSAYKLGTMIKVSKELLNDSAFPLDSFLAQDFGRRIGVLEEEAFVIGDGVNKPTGFVNTAPVGTTVDSAITFDDIMDLYHSLKSPYRSKAVFLANDLTIKTIRQLKDTNGQYLWQPAVTAGTPDTILGRPVYTSAFMPSLEKGAKVLAFGDFSYYWIADRTGRTFERLNELFSATDQVGFKATQRVDGKLILPETIKTLQIAE